MYARINADVRPAIMGGLMHPISLLPRVGTTIPEQYRHFLPYIVTLIGVSLDGVCSYGILRQFVHEPI